MNSPITGKEMVLKSREEIINFRKEDFKIIHHFYLDESTGHEFTDEQLEAINIQQVYNQYRDKHRLAFPDEIKAMREKYGLSALKMAEILGFGINIYRNYESGEVPSESNSRLIQMAQDPVKFKNLIELSNVYTGDDLKKILSRIDAIIETEKQGHFKLEMTDYLLGEKLPDVFSGYKKPNLDKLTEMVVYFTEKIQPYKTKMNKLLFYADFLCFRNTCFSMSGTRYRAIDMGPVPNNFNSIFEFMANNDDIDILQTEFENEKVGEQFKPNPNRKFNSALFAEDELKTLQTVADKFKKTSTKEIIDISHKEKAWKENFENGKRVISYNYGFELGIMK